MANSATGPSEKVDTPKSDDCDSKIFGPFHDRDELLGYSPPQPVKEAMDRMIRDARKNATKETPRGTCEPSHDSDGQSVSRLRQAWKDTKIPRSTGELFRKRDGQFDFSSLFRRWKETETPHSTCELSHDSDGSSFGRYQDPPWYVPHLVGIEG